MMEELWAALIESDSQEVELVVTIVSAEEAIEHVGDGGHLNTSWSKPGLLGLVGVLGTSMDKFKSGIGLACRSSKEDSS